MAVTVNHERPWPRRRLQGFIAMCFVVQVLLILLLGERDFAALKPARFGTAIHLVSDPWSMERLAAFSEFSDPSVFALPSLDGFSRAGWLTYKPVLDEFAESPQEPRWLQPDPGALGRDLAPYVASNTPAPIRVADKSLPEIVALLPRPGAELEFPRSGLQIGGALGRRKLLSSPELPGWPHTDVLTNSIIRLSVDAEGTAISAALVSGSGLKEADNYALAASKRLRFKPERARETVTSGTVTFQWQTVAPGAGTNIVSPGLISP